MQMRDREQGPQRWFKRGGDGVIFPMTDEYHCKRLLQEGWTEVTEAEAKGKPGEAPIAAPAADPRDAQIALLQDQVAQLMQLFSAPPAAKPEEPADATAPNHASIDRGSSRPDRRPR
jgi:hypothetical protein